MALHIKNRHAAYYQSAEYCRNYTSPPVSYGDNSHYLARIPGPEPMLKPPLTLFSHPQQPFQHIDTLHQLGPLPLAPTQTLCPPPMAPAQAIGPATMVPTQRMGLPPPISATHTLGPPPITPGHRLGPHPLGPAQPLGPPPMVHRLGPPPMDPQPALGPPPLNATQVLGPPPLVAPGSGHFPLHPSPMSAPPPQTADPLPPRPPGPVPIPALVSSPILGPFPGPLLAQAAPASEPPQDEGSPLGMEEPEGSMELEELCKPLYCKLCNVTLNSAQQAQAHYQGKNHSKKLRNFYAGSQQPPAIRIPEVLEAAGQAALNSGPSDSDTARQALYKGATRVILATENDYCKLCDASFSSPAVAQAHYQGKTHAKKLRLAEVQHSSSNIGNGVSESIQRRNRKDGSEYRLIKTRRNTHLPAPVPGPYYNPRPRQRIPRDLAMCVTPSGQYYCSMCNCGAEQEADFRLHLESKQHKAKVSELRYRNEMEHLGYS